MIPVEYIPETIFIKDALDLLTKKRKSIAVVLDEYGGTSGIITIEDIIEQLDKGWDIMIAFPPCTHLAVSGSRHFAKKIADGRQQEGIDFFMKFVNAPIDKIVIENPIGIMSKIYRKPDQIIHPYYFGDPFSKSTCLWLKNVPKLVHQKESDLFNEKTHTKKGNFIEWVDKKSGKLKRQALWQYQAFGDGKKRSKTVPGIAKAMAIQWNKL